MDPVTLSILVAVAGLGLYAANAGAFDGLSISNDDGSTTTTNATDPSTLPPASLSAGAFEVQPFGFPMIDVAPSNQGGRWKLDFDDAMMQASVQTGVPFALIKAHCIAESALVPSASRTEPNGRKSYGLSQILWWPNSNRFANWGYSDDKIGDGSILYDPTTCCYIGAMIMQDNLKRLGNLTDAINAYNTGVAASVRIAPLGYVDKVKGYYTTLVGTQV